MLTKRLRQIPNARHFRFALNLVFTEQCLKSGGLRCSLLNAALGFSAGNIEFEDFRSWIMKRSYDLLTKS